MIISLLWQAILLGCIVYSVFVFTDFYTIYNSTLLRQTEGLWLYQQCLQPEFLAKLSVHSDACQHITLVFEKSPFQMALHRSVLTKFLYSCQTSFLYYYSSFLVEGQSLCLVILAALIVLILIPPYIALIERRERERLSLAAYCRSQKILRMRTPKNQQQHEHANSSVLPNHGASLLTWRRKRLGLLDSVKV